MICKKRLLQGFLLIFLAGVFVLYSSDAFVFDFVDEVNEATLNHAVVNNARHLVLKSVDNVNPLLAIDTGKNPNIREFNLLLSTKDFEYFKKASFDSVKEGYITKEASDYRKVILEHDGKSYNVGMALFGDRPENVMFNKKAFKIRFDTNRSIEGMQRLNFNLPENRHFFVSIFQAEVSKKLGLIPLNYFIADVSLQGTPQGLYFVEENIKEYNKRLGDDVVILQYSDNWIEDHPVRQSDSLHWKLAGMVSPGGYDYTAGVVLQTGHNTPFDLDISNFDELDVNEAIKINYQLYRLLKAVRENDQTVFDELIDIENVSSIEALRALFGNVHNFTGDNLRLSYNVKTEKFGFVPRFEGNVRAVKIYGGGIDYFLTRFAWEYVPILQYVLRNNELRHLRNEKLYGLLKDKEEILEVYKELDEMYRQDLVRDTTSVLSSREISHFLDESLEAVEGNFPILLKQFEYNKCYINIVKEDANLLIEVVPDGVAGIMFDEFVLVFDGNAGTKAVVRIFDADGVLFSVGEVAVVGNVLGLSGLFNPNLMQASLGEEMEPIRTVFRNEVFLVDAGGFEIVSASVVAKSRINGKRVLKKDVYVKIAER